MVVQDGQRFFTVSGCPLLPKTYSVSVQDLEDKPFSTEASSTTLGHLRSVGVTFVCHNDCEVQLAYCGESQDQLERFGFLWEKKKKSGDGRQQGQMSKKILRKICVVMQYTLVL